MSLLKFKNLLLNDINMKKPILTFLLSVLFWAVSLQIFGQCAGGFSSFHASSLRSRSRGYSTTNRNTDSSWTELKTTPLNTWDDVQNYYLAGISQRVISIRKNRQSSSISIPTIDIKLIGFGQRISPKFSGNFNFDILAPTQSPDFADNNKIGRFVGIQTGLELDYQVFSSNKWRVEAFDNIQFNFISLNVNALNRSSSFGSWENYLRNLNQKTVSYEEFTNQMAKTERSYIPLKNYTFTNQTGLELDYKMHSVALGVRVGYNWQFDNDNHYWDYCYQQNRQSTEYFEKVDGPELDLSGIAIGLNLNFLVGKRYAIFHPKS